MGIPTKVNGVPPTRALGVPSLAAKRPRCEKSWPWVERRIQNQREHPATVLGRVIDFSMQAVRGMMLAVTRAMRFGFAVMCICAMWLVGCECQSGGTATQTFTRDLDAGPDSDTFMSCSACPNRPIGSGFPCLGDCYPHDVPGSATVPCWFDACVSVVRDPNSSCESICRVLETGGEFKSCSFGGGHTTVSCVVGYSTQCAPPG
jgi:hypothetical protein